MRGGEASQWLSVEYREVSDVATRAGDALPNPFGIMNVDAVIDGITVSHTSWRPTPAYPVAPLVSHFRSTGNWLVTGICRWRQPGLGPTATHPSGPDEPIRSRAVFGRRGVAFPCGRFWMGQSRSIRMASSTLTRYRALAITVWVALLSAGATLS